MTNMLLDAAREIVSYLRFAAKTHLIGHDIPNEPHFDESSKKLFSERLAATSTYLEYGTGGSTVWAWAKVKNIVSIDSDARFLAALNAKLRVSATSPKIAELIYANIGFTKAWGVPIFTRATKQRLDRWEYYVKAPWQRLKLLGIIPDTILIDGRFRVACVLESIFHLPEQSPCLILVDDYADRPHYRAVEAFADIVAMHGRMAVLRKKPLFDRDACAETLAGYCKDWR